MKFHQHAQVYQPPQVFSTAPRRPRFVHVAALTALAVVLAFAVVGLAASAANGATALAAAASHVHRGIQAAHDAGVDTGLQTCGMVR